MAYHVYVLENPQGRRYIGQTADLAARLTQHNDSANRLTLHTKRHPGPWTLIYAEEQPTRADAMRREKWLKSGVGREWLVRRIAPTDEAPGPVLQPGC